MRQQAQDIKHNTEFDRFIIQSLDKNTSTTYAINLTYSSLSAMFFFFYIYIYIFFFFLLRDRALKSFEIERFARAHIARIYIYIYIFF